MDVKMFEIRDRGTFIPAMAVNLSPRDERDRWLLARAGYGTDADAQKKYVILMKLVGEDVQATYDEHRWGRARTMTIAHQHIIENWDALQNGQVICVETILGERDTPKVSEQETVRG